MFICDIKYDLKLHMFRVSRPAYAASYDDKNSSTEHFLMRSVCRGGRAESLLGVFFISSHSDPVRQTLFLSWFYR